MNKTLTKCVRFQMVKPICNDEQEWKDFYHQLESVSYSVALLANRASREYFQYFMDRKTFLDNNVIGETKTGKKKYAKYPIKPPRKEVYHILRELNPEILTDIISSVEQAVYKKVKSDERELLWTLTKSLPNFKKGYPVPIRNSGWSLIKKDDEYFLEFSLYSTKVIPKKIHRRWRILLNTHRAKIRNSSQLIILDRIISGEYKKGDLKIKKNVRKKKWDFIISFTFEPKCVELDKDKIVGIDLGINSPVVCATLEKYENETLGEGQELHNFRQGVRRQRKTIQKQYPDSTRKGKGRKKVLKPIEKLSKKERNFRDTKTHIWSKRCVDFAINNNCGKIVMEDLSSLKLSKQGNFLLDGWPIYDLQTKITQKAEEKGIEVIYVNPRYTSQRCSFCGCIHPDNRKVQEIFECINCNKKLNADINAARNLATSNIEKLINEYIKEQKK